MRGQNSPVDYFNKYPGRFTMLHIKDHREIGQRGMVGYDAIFKNTDTAGVRHIVAEIEKYSCPVEAVSYTHLDVYKRQAHSYSQYPFQDGGEHPSVSLHGVGKR